LVVVAATGPFSGTLLWRPAYLALASVATLALGAWSAGHAERVFGRKDPGAVVIDEVCGQIVAFLARPNPSWQLLLAGFIIFRVCDVLKPPPARRLEQLPGGWGIVLDDVVAGAYSLVIVYLAGLRLR
jgi:phosphatidylglycerophosphatase A